MAFDTLTYNRDFASPAVPGLVQTTSDHTIEAHQNASGAEMLPGVFVTQAGDQLFDEIDASGDVLLGVIARSMIKDPANRDAPEGIADGETANICTDGVVWVRAEEAMAIGDPVYVRHTANGAGKDVLGVVRNDADTANARLTKGARVVAPSATAPDGSNMVKLQISGLLDKATI